MTRQTKTPKQRAEEQLGIAERRLTKALARRNGLAQELAAAELELEEATAFRRYATNHPALKQSTTPASTTPPKEEGNA